MNEDPKDALMKKYQQEIEELKKMLEQPEESEEDEGSESGEESEEESDSGDVVIGDTQSHTSGSPQKTGTSPPKSSPEKSTTLSLVFHNIIKIYSSILFSHYNNWSVRLA